MAGGSLGDGKGWLNVGRFEMTSESKNWLGFTNIGRQWIPNMWSRDAESARSERQVMPWLYKLVRTRWAQRPGSHQLVKPWHNLSFGSHAFCISAAHIWNSLPTNIHEAQSVLTFRCHLKTHYYQSAFSTPSDPPANATWFYLRYQLYKNHLLTT